MAAKTTATDAITTAYYNTYIQGLDKILADVQQTPKAPTGAIFDATVPIED